MGSNPKVIAEFTQRQQAEKAKARDKYGPDALLPAGHPQLDILDYTINECVGLIRYAQMLEARHQLMLDTMESINAPTRALLRDGISFAHELEAFAARASFDAIDLRQQLKKKGLHLGFSESAI